MSSVKVRRPIFVSSLLFSLFFVCFCLREEEVDLANRKRREKEGGGEVFCPFEIVLPFVAKKRQT